MKTNFPILLLNSLLCCFVASSVNARPLALDSGWEFTLSLNTGYVSGQSNIAVGDDNEVIDSLDSKGESEDSLIIFPFARVQYTTEDLDTQFFLGNSREQIAISQFQYELGVTHQFSNKSKLTAAYFPELPFFNEAWQDPFVVGEVRVETDHNTQGGRIELTRIAGGPFTLKYAYARSRFDDDSSGETLSEDGIELSAKQLQSLQRDSNYHRIVVESMFPVASKTFLKPALQYTLRDADGNANSYLNYDFKLALIVFRGRHTSITTFNIGSTLYEHKNPIFDAKQDSLNMGIFSIYSYAQPFDWEGVTFTLLAGYSEENADITFYDKKALIFSTGLAYTF